MRVLLYRKVDLYLRETVLGDPTEELRLSDLKDRLSIFLSNNPSAALELRGSKVVVSTPWGDDTIILEIPQESDEEISILNSLVLPPLYSAIFHLDSTDLEFVFSPRRPEVYGRSFKFNFHGRAFVCEFADVSDRLNKLAAMAKPIAPPSHTDHRNLAGFNLVRLLASGEQQRGTSFWIREIAWDDNFILELARSLNFYMWYFDRESPMIQIHERSKLESPGKMPRFLFDSFPSVIPGRKLDTFLLQLWESFSRGNAIHRVLYGYQIVEYVAFYHLQESISQVIRRVLVAPESLERSGEATRQILEAIAEDRMEDAAKIEKVVEIYVDHQQLANAVQRNTTYFCKDVLFDVVYALLRACVRIP